MNELWDRLGISASVLCILHCLITPALVFTIPLVGNFLSAGWVHLLMAVVVIPVAFYALWRGYRIHRLKRTAVFGAFGMAFIVSGMSFGYHTGVAHPHEEVVLMIIGGALLSAAHFFNLRACRLHNH